MTTPPKTTTSVLTSVIVLLEELPAADRQRVIKTVMAHFSGDLPPQQQRPDHNQPRPQTSRSMTHASLDNFGGSPSYGTRNDEPSPTLCGQHVRGHHAGTCTLPAGHKGDIHEEES